MTKASTGRNARRGKIGFVNQLQRAYVKGRTDLANELQQPGGVKLPDGRILRLAIYTPTPEAPPAETPAPIGVVDPPQPPVVEGADDLDIEADET